MAGKLHEGQKHNSSLIICLIIINIYILLAWSNTERDILLTPFTKKVKLVDRMLTKRTRCKLIVSILRHWSPSYILNVFPILFIYLPPMFLSTQSRWPYIGYTLHFSFGGLDDSVGEDIQGMLLKLANVLTHSIQQHYSLFQKP